jgi:hypothetical protein
MKKTRIPGAIGDRMWDAPGAVGEGSMAIALVRQHLQRAGEGGEHALADR